MIKVGSTLSVLYEKLMMKSFVSSWWNKEMTIHMITAFHNYNSAFTRSTWSVCIIVLAITSFVNKKLGGEFLIIIIMIRFCFFLENTLIPI